MFLKAYFYMVIEAPELQTEVRSFLKDTTKTYMEILEVIHANCRGQTTGEDIRGVLGVPTTTSPLSRRTTVNATKSKRESDVEKAWVKVHFPDNVGRLISTEYYSQVKRCYDVLSKPTTSYTTSVKLFISSFNFNFELPPPQDQRGGGSAHDGRNSRGVDGNWRNERDSQNSTGNWEKDIYDQNYPRNQVNRSETGTQGC